MRLLAGVVLTVTLLLGSAGVAYSEMLETGFDRPGGDYSSATGIPKPGQCQDLCQDDDACRSWTWVKPGIQGAKSVCYLKSVIPPQQANSCCTSGVKLAGPIPPNATAGTDRFGSDYASITLSAPKPQACADACAGDAACKAWTYVNAGIKGPQAICFLKNAVPAASSDSCCISGVKAALPPPVTLPPGAAADKDRPGSDFASSVLPGPNPKLCYDQCEANAACKAWTYVKPGVQGPKPLCYLKKAVPNAVNDTCCISGVKSAPPAGKIEKNTNRPGGDYVEFPLGGQKTEAFCMAACALQGKCKAWTFVKPGYQGSKARCWLKSKVPPAEYDECCTSGVK